MRGSNQITAALSANQKYADPELLSRIAEGDEAAFFTLFSEYAPLIRPFARNVTHSADDAEEILQETFIRIWLHRDKITEIENLRSWIFTVAARESMRYMREKLTYERKVGESIQQIPAQTSITPLHYAQLAEVQRVIRETVAAMPAQRKLIYQLSREEGLKPSAIAEKLSLSVGTVKNVLSHALKDIREVLTTSGIPLSLLVYHFSRFL